MSASIIQAELSGDGRAIARLDALRLGLPQRLRARIDQLAMRLQGGVVAKLSNDVLRLRSGRLAGSITLQGDDRTDVIAAAVTVTGPAAAYAGLQEYGGIVTIRAHLRQIREAWGRPLAGGAKEITVRSHQARYPARSFMRSALAEMRSEIQDGIAQAVAEAVGESGP